MSDRYCKHCRWFAKWPDTYVPSWEHGAEGVCTAPRPLLGPQPEREVRGGAGKHCPMFSSRPPPQAIVPNTKAMEEADE